ncbi:membrane protein insertion efficiency factor YidD [Kocuria sp.]|uniref:membrane protein insertion efficiency factor YidD n=1 Tax=Kocuria sp. TaxID=1871328 RepID=UPI0026DF67D4|nr:membrane protein insertion efficiency factor YidD [Kocuria sp.]MDO5618976.1 membrane protein insertion efficiency factor YidD [Kocuria sp.]
MTEARHGLSTADSQHSSPQELFDAAPSEFVHANTAFQVLWLLPQNLLIAGLKVYRALVSPLYGDVCKHFPTCSAYGLEAMTRHGAVRGLGLTVRRLLRCHPWAAGGIDRVPDGGRRFTSVAELPKIVLLNHPTPEDRARLLASFAPAASARATQNTAQQRFPAESQTS